LRLKERISASPSHLATTESRRRSFDKFHHAPVAFCLIIGEGNGWITKETQRVFFALCESQEEIVSGLARRTTAAFAGSVDHGARQRHLGLMEGQPKQAVVAVDGTGLKGYRFAVFAFFAHVGRCSILNRMS
jgi:hypothetical protein